MTAGPRLLLKTAWNVELRPAVVWQDTNSASFKLLSLTRGSRSTPPAQLNARLQVEARYNHLVRRVEG